MTPSGVAERVWQAMADPIDVSATSHPPPPPAATSNRRLTQSLSLSLALARSSHPPFSATRPSTTSASPVPSPSQLASSRSRQRLPPTTEFHPTSLSLPSIAPTHQTKSRSRYPSRVCLQWRCATPIIPLVLHLRTDCIAATTTTTTITRKR